ncbi:hypothetical protein LCGC14_1105930 [marine sediment metagenome]|uniref:Uncharacterized protein n=1 Tax=marine sediment metagenome TaxID=412755 RepID=A0A0F9M830_9ZZZZ
MKLLGIFRNGHRPDQYWRERALELAGASDFNATVSPSTTQEVVERAEEYLKFIQTGKAQSSS